MGINLVDPYPLVRNKFGLHLSRCLFQTVRVINKPHKFLYLSPIIRSKKLRFLKADLVKKQGGNWNTIFQPFEHRILFCTLHDRYHHLFSTKNDRLQRKRLPLIERLCFRRQWRNLTTKKMSRVVQNKITITYTSISDLRIYDSRNQGKSVPRYTYY